MIRRLRSGSRSPASRSRKRSSARAVTSGTCEVLAEQRLDLLALALAQQAVVDEHAGEPVADRLVHERGGHRRVDAAREPAHRAPVADLRADPRGGVGDERLHRPARPRSRRSGGRSSRGSALPACVCATSGWNCTPQIGRSAWRTAANGEFSLVPSTTKPVGQPQHAVAVAHPHHALGAAGQIREQRVVALELEQRAAVLAVVGLLDQPAEPVGEQLQAVADPEHGPAQRDDLGVEIGRARVEHARRPAREHDAGRVPRLDLPRARAWADGSRSRRAARGSGARSAA